MEAERATQHLQQRDGAQGTVLILLRGGRIAVTIGAKDDGFGGGRGAVQQGHGREDAMALLQHHHHGACLPDPGLSPADLILRHAAVCPSAPTLVDVGTGRALIFEALRSTVLITAAALSSRGVICCGDAMLLRPAVCSTRSVSSPSPRSAHIAVRLPAAARELSSPSCPACN